MFRRRSAPPEATDATQPTDSQSGKGRPTPSRREAEEARKARLKPTVDKRTAAKQDRQRVRTERERARQAMLNGDPRYLPVRDQGPVRKFARDYVDSRRSLGEIMLPVVLLFLVLSFIPNVTVRGYGILGFYVYMLVLVVDTGLLAWRVKRKAAERYPDETAKGAGMYAAMRSLQLRRLRLPKPEVKPGARV